MATTDSRLALASLEGMKEAGIRFALLHGRERLLQGDVSDVDMVVGEPPTAVVSRAAASWASRGLMPVVVWPYDIGGAATVFLATPEATEGVQLDLLFDPDGIGKYGLRSAPLLFTAGGEEAISSVSDAASLIYQWQKRTIKRDATRLAHLTGLAAGMDREALLLVSEAVSGSRDPACRMLAGRPALGRRPFGRLGGRGIRLARRAVRPVGFWAHAAEPAMGAELASLFSRFLVCARAHATPSLGRQPAWWLTRIQPIRLRPALVVSTGEPARWATPDVVVSAPSIDGAARQVTAAMAARFPSSEPRPVDPDDGRA